MESSDDATAGYRHLKFLDGKRKSVIVWVVHQEAMKDVFLDALGLVTGRNQGAGGSNDNIAFINSSVLCVFDAVGFDVVDDSSPLAIDVDGT